MDESKGLMRPKAWFGHVGLLVLWAAGCSASPLHSGRPGADGGSRGQGNDGSLGDVVATQAYFGSYLATGPFSTTEQASSDAGVDSCSGLPSTPGTVSWGWTVSAGTKAGTVLITFEIEGCTFLAHEDAPGVFSATDADCLPLPNGQMAAIGGYSLILHYLTLDVPGGIVQGERIIYWYNPLYGQLMMCTSFDLRLSS